MGFEMDGYYGSILLTVFPHLETFSVPYCLHEKSRLFIQYLRPIIMKPQLNFYASISQHHTSTQACPAHPCKIVCISQMHQKAFVPVHHFNAICSASLCISSALYHSSFLAQLRHHLLLKFSAPSLSALILYVRVFFFFYRAVYEWQLSIFFSNSLH